MKPLEEEHILLDVSLGGYHNSLRRMDRKATADTLRQNCAPKKAGAFTKSIVDPEFWKPLLDLDAAISEFYVGETKPYLGERPRLFWLGNFPHCMDGLGAFAPQREALVDIAMSNLPAAVDDLRRRHRGARLPGPGRHQLCPRVRQDRPLGRVARGRGLSHRPERHIPIRAAGFPGALGDVGEEQTSALWGNNRRNMSCTKPST